MEIADWKGGIILYHWKTHRPDEPIPEYLRYYDFSNSESSDSESSSDESSSEESSNSESSSS